MQQSLNVLALRASKDERAREQLIQEQEQTILRTASAVSRRYVGRSDDEWSVALCAFSRAVDLYDEDRGDFLPFAQMLIRRELVDAHRADARHMAELSVAPQVLEGSAEPEEDTESVYLAVVRDSVEAADRSLHDEIVAANEMLEAYGFRFFDLTACSPQQEKTRQECAAAVRALLRDPPLLVRLLRQKRKLPMAELQKLSGVSRKTLDRYRRYIIMAALILSDDYPQLAEYLKFVKEGVRP
jgi:RNA polymerase sigma factor